VSYTNVEQVRHHLVARFPIQDCIRDQIMVVTGNDYTPFYGGAVEESSFRVKSHQTNEPTRTSFNLASGRNSLVSAPLVRGSVVVASDSSLGEVYIENLDYIVDYDTGDLIAKSGGGLSSGQSVTVWYMVYTLYEAGSDYQVRAERGEIRVLAGGDIADGEAVWLDYQPVHQSFNEEILANAVVTANGLVEREVDPDRQFGADTTLGAAATCRALEIICRTAAARELTGKHGADKNALVWMKLADEYTEQADKLLRAFRAPYSGPAAPRHS